MCTGGREDGGGGGGVCVYDVKSAKRDGFVGAIDILIRDIRRGMTFGTGLFRGAMV